MKKILLLLTAVQVSFIAPSQDLLWTEVVGGLNDQFVEDMTTDDDGNLFVTGAFNNTVDFGEGENAVTLSALNPDIFIACYNDGALLWAKQVGANAASSGLSIQSDGENLVVTGAFSGTATVPTVNGDVVLQSNGSYDMFIARLNEDGDFLWVRTIGGNGLDELTDIAFEEETFWACGSLIDGTDLGPGDVTGNITTAGGYDGVAFKFDLDGNILVAKTFGGANFDKALTIDRQDNNNLMVTGHFRDNLLVDIQGSPAEFVNNGGSDVFVASMTSSGDLLWVKTFGTTEHDEAFGGAGEGNVYLAGKLEGTMDMNPGVGELLFSSAPEVEDMFLCRLSNDGDFVWARQVEVTDEIVVRDIFVEGIDIHIGGYFKGTTDFDPGEGETILTSESEFADPFMCNFTDDGTLNWAHSLQGNGSDYGNAILPTNDGVFLGGSFSSDIDLDPGIDAEPHTSLGGGGDLFIVQLDYGFVPEGTEEIASEELILYPNPSDGRCNILSLSPGTYSISVMDVTGRLCMEKMVCTSGSMMQVTLPGAPGVYTVHAVNESGKKYSTNVVRE